jgi:hypothetical protein
LPVGEKGYIPSCQNHYIMPKQGKMERMVIQLQ